MRVAARRLVNPTAAGFCTRWVRKLSSFDILKQGFRSLACASRSYLLSFHQHSGLAPISGLFFIHILASSPTVQFRSFVFNNILGYTFIFAIIFLLYDSLQSRIDNRFNFKHLVFWKRAGTSLRFLAKLLYFHQHSGFHRGFPGLLPAVEGEPTNAIKKPRH